MERWRRWAIAMGEDKGPVYPHLIAYLRWLALNASGSNVENTARCLKRVYGDEMSPLEKRNFKGLVITLAQEANMRNPPVFRAADALPGRVLVDLVERAAGLKGLLPIESIALDALVVAFATLSRTGEILQLCVEDVEEEGKFIRVVTKTDAVTKQSHIKAVEDGYGLRPVGVLKRRRHLALQRGRPYLFPSTRNPGTHMDSKEATHGLQLLTRHCAVRQRITCHSARKGAATEAVLAGIPLVVVQGYGLWKGPSSLEKYVGEVFRQRYPFLQTLEAAARD